MTDRVKHIKFILNDTKQRGEQITSDDINFFGALYFLKVKKEGNKRSKSIVYSAATTIQKGYREIK
jgi:hypothetical protein